VKEPRVALVSVELGRIRRGFERYFGDLFEVLRERLDVTLYKGGGAATAREQVPALLGPASALARALPLGSGEYRAYKRNCLAFAACLLPALLRERFDVVHFIDPPLARLLPALGRATGLGSRLLFTEGCLMPPRYYPRVAHIHHVGHQAYCEALESGVPESHLSLVPCGLHCARFVPPAQRGELRRQHGIAEGTFVVLAISAVKREHKRVDHLIDEVARLDGDVLLWIDGHAEEPALVEQARSRLGPRCRITHLASAQVPELYGLADVLAHAALGESFGLAIVEALASGLPVLVHDAPHFAWLTEDRDSLVDMAVPGALAARLGERIARGQPAPERARARADSVRRRFDWVSLAPAYQDLYRKVAAL
jgi:glycosyltransferase involved in cell wall biosynthesis